MDSTAMQERVQGNVMADDNRLDIDKALACFKAEPRYASS